MKKKFISYDCYVKDKEKYKKMKNEFLSYQECVEQSIQRMSEKITFMEKKIDMLSNTIEISKYINSSLSNDDLVSLINDMIIGVTGATYCTIYVREDNKMKVKATNVLCNRGYLDIPEFGTKINQGESFIKNCKDCILEKQKDAIDIHSIIGIPINVKTNTLGYIIVEHKLYNFFSHEHVIFLTIIANQVGIALENNMLYHTVKDNSIKDSLLGISNRRNFFEKVEENMKLNYNQSFAIVMVDLDDFKKVNDRYGHLFGDEALISSVKVMKKYISERDIIARYGGEEIIIYIPNVNKPEEIFNQIDNMRIEISKTVVECFGEHSYVTASFGIACYPLNGIRIEQVISEADKALYRAKNNKKNKVACA